ncbi:MAG: tyrosine-type recombinase/integrase, partial [Geminicoccaceae bacterium]|nr:tyrosine-type recombinase/integrase [Geminicoccaceae bacterium]
MATLKIRHLRFKHGKYYWEPSANLKALGFRSVPLGDDRIEAIALAEKKNAEADAERRGEIVEKHPTGSIPWLIREYCKDESYQELAHKTKRGYLQAFKIIEEWSASKGHPQVAKLNRQRVQDYRRHLMDNPPPKAKYPAAHAKKIMTHLRILLGYAVDQGYLETNPARNLKIKYESKRFVRWRDDETQALVATADAINRPSLGTAALLASNLGQRQADILALTWTQYDGESFQIRQQKTGELVDVPVFPEVAERLAETPRSATTVVVSEETGRPYKEGNFRPLFAKLKAKAGITRDVVFQDYRRTCVVRLAMAGCTTPEICAITSHTLKSAEQILEHYLPRNSEMARNAHAKVLAWQSRPQVGKLVGKAVSRVGKVVPRGG